MATLTVQLLSDAGTAPTLSAATTSDRADIGTGSNTFLWYKNTDTVSHNIVISHVGQTTYAVNKPDNTITLAANTGQALIPLRKEYDQGDGLGALITAASVVGVTVALVRFS